LAQGAQGKDSLSLPGSKKGFVSNHPKPSHKEVNHILIHSLLFSGTLSEEIKGEIRAARGSVNN
jgi:hypothetical protein